jgi:PAS domain S-box-containing protein
MPTSALSASVDPAVLLVDDHATNLVALEATLAPLGVRLVSASSGPAALRHLLSAEFALILLDVQMPGMDGFETARLIKQHPRTAETPIIFVTAIHREAAQVFKGYERGGADYLLKPFDPSVLRSKVRVFIELYRKRKELAQQAALVHDREREDLERRSEQRFRNLLDSMSLCVWALRRDGTPYYRNRAWLEYAGAEAHAASFVAPPLVHPEDHAGVQGLWDQALREGQALEIEYRLRRAIDGAYRWHVGRVVPERDDGGNITGWIATATDIESQKRAEKAYARLVVKERNAREEAEAANRAKDEFLATLSHELRTPLHAMIGWTRMLRTRSLPPEKARKAIETIERNATVQAELIEDILDVSRIITGKLRIVTRPVDLSAIVDAAVEAVRPAAEAKQIAVEKTIDELPPRLSADGARLQQVIWNLLANAIKFTPAGGRVDVRVDTMSSGEVRIEVRDTGSGVSPEFKPHVFERFRQQDGSSRRAHGGLGLGLAIVRHLVEQHGGTVSCESPPRGETRGTAFIVRLPARVAASGVRAVDPGAPRTGAPLHLTDETAAVSLAGLRVLLVEDEPDARELLTEVLQEYGAVVLAAASARDGLDLLERERPDVLLSDIGLPGEDGYALISRVRALPPERGGETPAAALTAYARVDDAQRALAAGYHRHAPKPIHPAMLASLVHELARARAGCTPGPAVVATQASAGV